MQDTDIKAWITVNGQHIPIRNGETKEQAVAKALSHQHAVKTDEDTKQHQIDANKQQADKLNGSPEKLKSIFKRDKWFDQKLFDRLPKKMQVDNIVSISKERHGEDGTRYNASVV